MVVVVCFVYGCGCLFAFVSCMVRVVFCVVLVVPCMVVTVCLCVLYRCGCVFDWIASLEVAVCLVVSRMVAAVYFHVERSGMCVCFRLRWSWTPACLRALFVCQPARVCLCGTSVSRGGASKPHQLAMALGDDVANLLSRFARFVSHFQTCVIPCVWICIDYLMIVFLCILNH